MNGIVGAGKDSRPRRRAVVPPAVVRRKTRTTTRAKHGEQASQGEHQAAGTAASSRVKPCIGCSRFTFCQIRRHKAPWWEVGEYIRCGIRTAHVWIRYWSY